MFCSFFSLLSLQKREKTKNVCALNVASFVEDRLATLKNVIKEPELDAWNIYLGTPPLSLFQSFLEHNDTFILSFDVLKYF